METRRKIQEAEQALIRLEGQPIAYLIKRSSRRRTVGLSIDPEQGLVVHCPRRFSRARLETLLYDKSRWILEKSAQAERTRATAVHWAPGAPLPYQGALYPLEVHSRAAHGGAVRDICVEEGRLRLYLRRAAQMTPEALRIQVIAGYKAAAKREIAGRVAHFGARLSVAPQQVRIRAQKRRWGSCSSRGAVNFNWRLILAPAAVMDYVIVHELCHLLVLDHSPRFWEQVAAVLPDYAMRRNWLREHGAGLFI